MPGHGLELRNRVVPPEDGWRIPTDEPVPCRRATMDPHWCIVHVRLFGEEDVRCEFFRAATPCDICGDLETDLERRMCMTALLAELDMEP